MKKRFIVLDKLTRIKGESARLEQLIEEVEGISKLSLAPEAVNSYFIDFTVHFFPPFWNKLEKIELRGIEVGAPPSQSLAHFRLN